MYEYKVIYDPVRETFESDCNDMGGNGWRMISAWCDERNYFAAFERKKSPALEDDR